MGDKGSSFASNFKRATNPLVILLFLNERDMYGYELHMEIFHRNRGTFDIAALYPVLCLLQQQGYVSISKTVTVDGCKRIYYHITDSGRDYLASTISEFYEVSASFQDFIKLMYK